MTRILIAGIGNIFLGDDAFGPILAQRLAERTWPLGVRVADFGLRCLELAYALLDDWDAAILVDAASRAGEPGALYHIALDLGEAQDIPLNAHSLTVDQVVHLARRLAAQLLGRLPPITMIGCQPQTLEPVFENDALSPPVAAAVPGAIAMISDLVREFTQSPFLEVTAS